MYAKAEKFAIIGISGSIIIDKGGIFQAIAVVM